MQEAPNADPRKVPLVPQVSEGDHAQGLATAAITLVEFGDYHDPACAASQAWVKACQAQLGDRLHLVFRHFPVSHLHPHAAQAAESAALQGRFWQMHTLLFEHPEALGNGYLVEYAEELGLDINQFLRDMTGSVCAERVRLNLASGVRSGVTSLPAFFVNGMRRVKALEEDAAFTFDDG